MQSRSMWRALSVCVVMLLLFAASAATPAVAADGGWRPAGSLPTGMTFSPVSIAYAPDGTAWAAWGELTTGKVFVAQRERGGDWGEPDEVEDQGAYPSVTVSSRGVPTVVWAEGSPFASTGVLAAVPDGEGWEVDRIDGGFTAVTSSGARVITTADGTTTAGWTSGNEVVFATRLAGGEWQPGSSIYTAMKPGVEPPEEAGNLNGGFEMAADRSGRISAVVRDSGLSSSQNGIRTFTRETPQSGWTTAQPSPAGPASGNHYAPQIAVAPSGATVVTWSTLNPTEGYRAAVRREGQTGFDPVKVLSTSGGGSGVAAPVAYLANGEAMIAWEVPAAGGQPARVDSLRLRHRRGASDVWNPVETVATAEPGGGFGVPILKADPVDGATVVFPSTPAGGDPAVVASRYAHGAGWSEPEAISELGSPAELVPGMRGGAGADPIGGLDVAFAQGDAGFRTAAYDRNPEVQVDWTAHGLTGTLNLRTWINYLGGTDGVIAEPGASRPDQYDPYRYRFKVADAWKVAETGETVVQLDGTIRYSYPSHFIDVHIVDPQIRLSADGASGAVIADGQGSGSMEDALAGNPRVVPFSDARLMDLHPAGLPAVPGADGSTRTWSGVPATIGASPANEYLSYDSGSGYGFFTITVPSDLRTVSEPPVVDPPGGPPGPGGTDQPPAKRKKVKTRAWLTGPKKVRSKPRKKVTLLLARRLGESASASYRVKLTRKGKLVAKGVLKGRKAKLTVRKQKVEVRVRGRSVTRAKLPVLRGRYDLRPVKPGAAMSPATVTIG